MKRTQTARPVPTGHCPPSVPRPPPLLPPRRPPPPQKCSLVQNKPVERAAPCPRPTTSGTSCSAPPPLERSPSPGGGHLHLSPPPQVAHHRFCPPHLCSGTVACHCKHNRAATALQLAVWRVASPASPSPRPCCQAAQASLGHLCREPKQGRRGHMHGYEVRRSAETVPTARRLQGRGAQPPGDVGPDTGRRLVGSYQQRLWCSCSYQPGCTGNFVQQHALQAIPYRRTSSGPWAWPGDRAPSER